MANTHEPPLLAMAGARKHLGEHESSPSASVQLSKKASGCPQPQQVHALQIQKVHGDVKLCVVIGEDPPASTENVQQLAEQVLDDSSSRTTTTASQKPSKMPCVEDETTAGAALPAERPSDATTTQEKELSQRCAAADERRARETVGEAEKVHVKRTVSSPLLLPQRDAPKYRAIEAGNANTAAGGETRVNSDTLCSPTAFSGAATAASLTCSSPPSCTSRGERDVATKLDGEGEAAKGVEDVECHDIALPFPHRRVKPLGETRQHAVDPLDQTQSYNDQELRQPQSEHSDLVKLEHQQAQRPQFDTRNEHKEPEKEAHQIAQGCCNQLTRNASSGQGANENNGEEDDREKSTSAHCAAVTNGNTEIHVMDETPGSRVPLKATRNDVLTTGDNWAPSSSLKTLSSYDTARDADPMRLLPSPAAYGEEEIKALAPSSPEDVIAPLPAATIGRKSTTATTRSSRSSTLPSGDVEDLTGQRPSPSSTEAFSRCSQADPPSCSFCNSMNELAFPPFPGRLVTKFIAHVFEPQLQQLQRRLQENARQEPSRELQFDSSDGESVDQFLMNSTSRTTAAAQVPTRRSQTVELVTAGTNVAIDPGFTKAYTRDESLSSEGSFPWCPLQWKQLTKSGGASLSRTRDECFCNTGADGDGEDDASQKPAPSGMDGECEPLDFPPSLSPCIASSENSVRNRRYTELSSFSSAYSSIEKFCSTRGTPTAPDVTTAAALQKRPQSALLALQLKHHLLSLVCYMERLPKMSHLGLVQSSATPRLPENQAGSPSEMCTRQVLEPWQSRPSKDTEPATRSSSGLCNSNQFAFHMEELLRAEIVLPISSELKGARVFSTPAVPQGQATLNPRGVLEHKKITKASSLAVDFSKNQTVTFETACGASRNAAQAKALPQESGYTPEPSVACTLPSEAPANLPKSTETAEREDEIITGGMPEKRNSCRPHEVEGAGERVVRLNKNTARTGMSTPDAQPLVQQQSEEMADPSSLSYSSSVGMTVNDELLPETAEDTVLLGVPPSMVNYLIIFSPLLVLQTLQQMRGVPAVGEEPGGCSSCPHGHDRGAEQHSRHVHEKPPEEQKANSVLRGVTDMGGNIPGQRSRTPLTVVEDAVDSESYCVVTKVSTPTAEGLEGAAGGEYSYAATMASEQARSTYRREREERENPRIEEVTHYVPEPAVEVNAAGETASHATASSGATGGPAAASTEARRATVPAESGATTAAGGTFNRTGITPSALQAELRSALCSANRGLVALFRALSPPETPGSTSSHIHPVSDRSHTRTAVRQTTSPHICPHVSEEVTAESLTAALLLLAQAVKQSRCGRRGEGRLRASSHSNCDRCTREAVCAAGEQSVDSWHANCCPMQLALVTCRRLLSTTVSHNAPDSPSCLAAVPVELHTSQRQLWECPDYSVEPRRDVDDETQPKAKGDTMKEEDGRTNTERTKDVLECASSRELVVTPTRGDDLEAKVESHEFSRLRASVSPHLRTAHEGGYSTEDREGLCPLNFRARERGAAVFFAPLHYPQQDCASYASKDVEKLHFEAHLPKDRLPANVVYTSRGVVSKRTGAVTPAPVAESDFKPSADIERMAQDDLVERLALEILAQVDNTAFFHEEEGPDTAWQHWTGEHLQGKSGAHATNEDDPDYAKTEAGKRADPDATDDWLREVAQLFMERGCQEKSDISEESCLRASGHGEALLTEDTEARATRSGSCQDLQEHAQNAPRQETAKTDAGARAFRSGYTGKPVIENEVQSKGLPHSQYAKKRRYCAETDFLSPELRESDFTSYVNDSTVAESARIFEATRIQAEDGNAAAGDPNPPGSFKEPPSLRDQGRSHATRSCALSKNFIYQENPDATERGDNALEVATSTAPTVAARDTYLYLVSPEDGGTSYIPTERLSGPSCAEDVLSSVRADETNFAGAGKVKERHQRAMYEGACDCGTACASGRKAVKQQDGPKHRGREDRESQLNLQHCEAEESSRAQRLEAPISLPSAACSKVDSPSPTSRAPSVHTVISNAHPQRTTEIHNCSWENAKNGEVNRDGGAPGLARTRGNQRRSSAEDTRSLKEEISGKARLTWHRRPSKLQQRPPQVAEAADDSAGERGKEERSCRVKRRVPCMEEDTGALDEQPARDRRNGTRRSDPTVDILSLNEEAHRTRASRPMRAPSSACHDSEYQKGSWQEANQSVLPAHLGSADESDTVVDIRRPMRGVYFDRTQRSWIGSFYEDRRQIKKRFKVDTYGFLKAKALAVDVRLGYERRMLRGVGGASGIAASSGTEAASKPKRAVPARKDAALSLGADGGDRKAETLLAGDGPDSWITSATTMPPHAQHRLPSRSAQQRKLHLNPFSRVRRESTPSLMGENDMQVDGDAWIMQETRPSCLSRPSGDLAGDHPRISAKEKTGEFSATRVEADSAAEEGSEPGSSLCSYASSGLTSNVVCSSGGMAAASLNSAVARSDGTADGQGILRREPQNHKANNVEDASSHEVSNTMTKRTGADTLVLHVNVHAPQMCAADRVSSQSRKSVPLKLSVCSVRRPERGENCLSHTGTRLAAPSGSQPMFDTQSGQVESAKQSDQDGEFTESDRNTIVDRFCMSGDEKAHTGTEKTSWDVGHTRQRRAAPEGRCHAGRRELEDQSVSVQGRYADNYVCEKVLPVAAQVTAQHEVEHLATGDALQATASRHLAEGTTQTGKCQRNCENLSEEDTLPPSAHSCEHRSVGAASAATRGRRAFPTARLEGRSGHSCATVGYSTAEKEESGIMPTEREEMTSTSSAPVAVACSPVSESPRLGGHSREAVEKNDSTPSFRRGKALAILNSETASRLKLGDTDGSFLSAAAQDADASRATASIQGSSCGSLCTDEYPPIRPSTRRPVVAAVTAYMYSKRKKRPVDTPTEGGRGAAAVFVHDLPPGVFYTSKKHAYCANWYEGKRQLKRYFPICKLGEPEARRLAIAARRDAERREREARCRTGGSSSTQAGYTERKGVLDTTYAEHDLPSDRAALAPAPAAVFHPRAAAEDGCAVQTEQLQATSR